VLLFGSFYADWIPAISGRRLGGLCEETSGFSPRKLKQLAAESDGLLKVRAAARERLRIKLMDGGLSWQQASARLQEFPSYADDVNGGRPLTDLAALSRVQAGQHDYRRFQAAGERLDVMDQQLAQAWKAGCIQDIRLTIEEAGFAAAKWFISPDEELGCDEPALWRRYLSAATLADLDVPLRLLGWRLRLDWIACWDVDFCLSYFGGYAPRPLFPLVLPTAPRLGQARTPGKQARGMVATPTRRLVDLTAILLHKVRYQKWPESVPALEELAAWSGLTPGWLAKVGTGERPLSFDAYAALWRAGIERAFVATAREVAAPFPLYAVAMAFELMFIQRRDGKKGAPARSVILLDRDLYRWHWDRWFAIATADGEPMGDGPWPSILA